MMHRSLSRCVQQQRTLRSVSAVGGGGHPWLAASVTNSMQPVRPCPLEIPSSQIRLFRTSPPQMRDGDDTVGNNDAGMVCFNCGEKGHISRQCTNPRVEMKDRVRCFNCGKVGHMSFNCPEPRKNKACYNCGSEEHIARDCPNPVTKD